MKRGTFKISTNLFRFRDSAIIARVYVRNNNKAILTKAFAIQQSITPEAEVKKSVVYNDPEASTINYYFNLFKAEIKSLVETSTPEQIADDIQRLVSTPVFSNFFCLGRKKQPKREKQPKKQVMKRGTFKISTGMYRFVRNTVIVKVYVRNNNKIIYIKQALIQQTISPFAEVKKSVISNDPEASTINYYYSLFKNEVKSLVETSTPETIANDIQAIATTPVFAGFFAFNKVKPKQPKQQKKVEKKPKQPKQQKDGWTRRGRSRDLNSDVRIVRDFDPYAFSDDFQKRNTAIHFNQNGESLDIKFNYERAVKNGIYKGKNSNYYAQIRPYLPDIESWQQIQDDEEMKKKMEIYSSGAIIDFALDDEPTEEKEYAPYISRDQWEVMMDDYIQKLKIKWQQEEKQTAEK